MYVGLLLLNNLIHFLNTKIYIDKYTSEVLSRNEKSIIDYILVVKHNKGMILDTVLE